LRLTTKTPTVRWLRWKWLSSLLIRTNWIKPLLSCQQGLAAASDENLKAVINLRLARIQVQQKKLMMR
jgi:hypothetical protein